MISKTKKSIEKFSSSSLMTRLSLIILTHTALTFGGAWTLFSFPELGDSATGLAQQDALLIQQAKLFAKACTEKTSEQTAPVGEHDLLELFNGAAEELPEIRRQAVYTVADDGTVRLILDWEDDLSSGLRSLPADKNSERSIATSLMQDAPGGILRVTSEADGHHWADCYASANLPVSSANPDGSAICVYLATIATTPPTLLGQNFMASLMTFLLASLLIALLIIQLLYSKLSRPLKKLQAAFNDLSDNEKEREAPLLVEKCFGCALSPLIDSFNNMSTQLFWQHRDLRLAHSEIQDAATELAESKNLLETVLENSPDAVIVSDLHGEILFFNRAGRKQFGYGNEPAPTSITELFTKASADLSKPNLERLDRGQLERLGVRLNGEQFPALVSIAPLCNDGATANALLYLIRDITESQSYKAMMIRLDRLSIRGEMAGDIAHEINNYLTIIQGNVELLPRLIEKGSSEKITRKLQMINDTINRISTFSEGLMNFESQDSELSDEYPNQIIHNLLAFLTPQKRLSHVRINLELDPKITIVRLSDGLIQQALVNLVYNAADALGEHPENFSAENRPTITIKSSFNDHNKLQITVSDNGPGVSPEARDGLFKERFTTKRKGHGIGLLTCVRIAHAHSGELRYEDSSSGGASFILEIPARAQKSKKAIPTAGH